jgi:hypothetical protein
MEANRFVDVKNPTFLESRLTDGGYIVIVSHRPLPQDDSSYSFLLRVESAPGL